MSRRCVRRCAARACRSAHPVVEVRPDPDSWPRPASSWAARPNPTTAWSSASMIGPIQLIPHHGCGRPGHDRTAARDYHRRDGCATLQRLRRARRPAPRPLRARRTPARYSPSPADPDALPRPAAPLPDHHNLPRTRPQRSTNGPTARTRTGLAPTYATSSTGSSATSRSASSSSTTPTTPPGTRWPGDRRPHPLPQRPAPDQRLINAERQLLIAA